jgi:hypothetical protein
MIITSTVCDIRSSLEAVESLEGISDEWNIHLARLIRALTTSSLGSLSSLQVSGGICLVDFVNWEVGGVDIG